ncbi:MAG: type I 3-dehydroquinate dehydratase [Lachnospiraceae bacterium]|nr:type I 3-dehydroquinate dehydratase [Lachnospiraceae bacterium]
MDPVIIRNTVIGTGKPKICVPIVQRTEEEILAAAKSFLSLPIDVVEWRVDWFDEVSDCKQVVKTAGKLRLILGDIPLLFTFRTKEEGGNKSISDDSYLELNKTICESGFIDLVDVELFKGDALVTSLIETAHQFHVKVIASNHDFSKTPPEEELVKRLCHMQQLDADLPKIAVMPQSRKDVLTLLSATLTMRERYADRPIITMSMAGDGVISRLAGEVFGSALTFGSVGQASAPGQIPVEKLTQVLDIVHESYLPPFNE